MTGPCFTVEVAVSVVRATTLAVGTRTGTIRSRGTVDVARGSIAHEVTTAIAAAGAFAVRAGSRASVVVSTALDVAGRGGALEVAFRACETDAFAVAAFPPGLTSGGRNQQAQENGDRMTHNG